MVASINAPAVQPKQVQLALVPSFQLSFDIALNAAVSARGESRVKSAKRPLAVWRTCQAKMAFEWRGRTRVHDHQHVGNMGRGRRNCSLAPRDARRNRGSRSGSTPLLGRRARLAAARVNGAAF